MTIVGLAREIESRGYKIDALRNLKHELLTNQEQAVPLYASNALEVSIAKDEVLRQLGLAIHREKEAVGDLIRQLVLFNEGQGATSP